MALCEKCRDGNHQHDRFTSDGADAGCPFLANGGAECGCVVVVHTARSTRNGAHCATCTCGLTMPAPVPMPPHSACGRLAENGFVHYDCGISVERGDYPGGVYAEHVRQSRRTAPVPVAAPDEEGAL